MSPRVKPGVTSVLRKGKSHKKLEPPPLLLCRSPPRGRWLFHVGAHPVGDGCFMWEPTPWAMAVSCGSPPRGRLGVAHAPKKPSPTGVGSHKDHRPLLDFTPAPEPGSMSFACATPSKSPKRSIVSIFYAVVPQLGVWLCAEYQYLQIKLPKLSEIIKASARRSSL
jgi:hypothetical protein